MKGVDASRYNPITKPSKQADLVVACNLLEGHPGCLAVQTATASLGGKKVQAMHCRQVILKARCLACPRKWRICLHG